MQEITISNKFVKAVISEQAAEVISFMRLDNQIEAIWCGNPEFWFNRNPVLFPYTGPLVDGKYTYHKHTYELGQHGFARRAKFTLEEHDESSAVLSLTYNEDTLKVYPFKFRLEVRYSLDGYKLVLDYKVINLDDVDLPFDIGFHPAFNCPLTPDKKYSDYRIQFAQKESLKADRWDNVVVPDGDSFPLDKYLVKNSFFYHNDQIKSPYAELTDGEHTIRVGKEGFDTIGFWKPREEAPFMCIEPWAPKSNLRKCNFFRPDTFVNLLEPEDVFTCSYYFELVK